MNLPGCFASASVFSHDSSWCQKCEAFKDCSSASLETLKRIRATVNVDSLLARHMVARESAGLSSPQIPKHLSRNASETPEQVLEKTKSLLTLDQKEKIALITNKKAADYATGLCVRGYMVDAKEMLQAGKNPLEGKSTAGAMKVMLDALIEGGFTSRSMVERFVAEKGWGKATAESQASMLLAVLIAFDIVDCADGYYTLNKD